MGKLSLLVLFGASVLAGKPPERAPKAISGSHSNFTYGYSLQGKNDAHQKQIEHRKGEHVEGSFAVHLPDGQSVSDVEYTVDERGFHPIVRLSTKTNNSQVTSHFALGQSAVKRLTEQNEKRFDSISESKDSPSVTALISQYGRKDLNGFELKKVDQMPLINYDPKNANDTISQVLTSLFPDGIPKKYEELLNVTDDINFEIKTVPEPTTYTTRRTEEKEVTTSPFIISTEETKVRRGINIEKPKDYTRFPQKEKAYQHLISDEEVLQINGAAENFTEENEARTKMFQSVEQFPVHKLQAEEQRGGFADLQPFESPIVVEEQNDNLFASSSANAENYVAPPFKEISIIPGQRYVSSRNYDPERSINLKILDRGHGFKQAILKAASAQDLDSFQKIVEESFSHSPEYKTEAPSRTFLRELEEKHIKYSPSFEKQGRYKSSEDKYLKEENIQQIEEAAHRLLEQYNKERRSEYARERSDEKDDNEQRNEEGKAHFPKGENNPNTYQSTVIQPSGDVSIESRSEKGDTLSVEKLRPISQKLFSSNRRHPNDEDDGGSNSSPAVSSTSERSREKTFVEIAKAVNIQNLLIKEDEDSIERHEEYLQPLSFGDRLTHRIESKFMKTKPWQNYQQNPVSENHITLLPVTIRPSISYALAPEHIEYHPPEYHNFEQFDDVQQNPQEHHQIEEHPQDYQQQQQQQQHPQDQQHTEDPNQNFSEDPEEKDVEESRHISKLHTRVNYNEVEINPRKHKANSSDLRQSVATPVVAKYFPRPSPVVEKIVEKPVKVPFAVKEYVEKIVAKPVHVEKIIDRPVPVPYYVAVDRIIETPVHVPYPVDHLIAVEKLVETEIPIEVEKFVDRPVPFPVEQIINHPYPVDRPFPVHIPVKVPIPVHIPVKISVPNSYLTSQSTAPQTTNIQQPYIIPGKKNDLLEFQNALESVHSQPVFVQQKISDDINSMIKKQQLWPNNQILMNRNPKQMSGSEFQNVGYIRNDYYGPVPLQSEYSHWGGQHFKRSSDFGRNLRMEYGFKPPLIPSIEIDDQGIPVNRNKDS